MRKKYPAKQTKKTARTTEDSFFFIGCLLLAVCAFIWAWDYFCPATLQAALWRIRLPFCPFHAITGYYCPGCGGTRAVRALLHGHWIKAAYYHPAVPYGAAVYLYFMATQAAERLSRHRFHIGMRYHNAYVWACVFLIIGNFAVKNALHHFYGFIL